jgi:hypothetical protein
MEQQTETDMTTYQGSCHCGAVTFKIDAEIRELTTCDCSLCKQKNALMAKVHESALTVLGGEDLLSSYQWNTHRAKHFFCSRCGIYTFHRKRAAPDHFGITCSVSRTSILTRCRCARPRASGCRWSIPTRETSVRLRRRPPDCRVRAGTASYM